MPQGHPHDPSAPRAPPLPGGKLMASRRPGLAINPKDLAAGAMFVAIGGFFAGNALLELRLGTALNMGPAYFPALLGGLLVLIGIAIAATGINRPAEPFGTISVRGVVLVIAAIVFFGLTVRGLGFAPSLAVTVFLAAMSSRRSSVRLALAIAAVLTVFATLVFVKGLALPYPILGRWIV